MGVRVEELSECLEWPCVRVVDLVVIDYRLRLLLFQLLLLAVRMVLVQQHWIHGLGGHTIQVIRNVRFSW